MSVAFTAESVLSPADVNTGIVQSAVSFNTVGAKRMGDQRLSL